MDQKLKTILNVLLGAIIAISVVFALVFLFGASGVDPDSEWSDQIQILGWRLDAFLNWAVILTVIAAIAAIIFPLINMVTNPQGSKKSLLSILGILVVFALAYVIASDVIPQFPGADKFFSEEATSNPHQLSKYVGTGLYAMYILGGLSIIAIVYHEIAKFFK